MPCSALITQGRPQLVFPAVFLWVWDGSFGSIFIAAAGTLPTRVGVMSVYIASVTVSMWQLRYLRLNGCIRRTFTYIHCSTDVPVLYSCYPRVHYTLSDGHRLTEIVASNALQQFSVQSKVVTRASSSHQWAYRPNLCTERRPSC